MSIILKSTSSDYWSKGRLSLAAVTEETVMDSAIVGCIDLYDYDPLHQRAAVGIAVLPQLRQQGYATAMLRALSVFCTHTISLHQLYADILTSNIVSLHLFQQSGYQRCALMRDWICQEGRYLDAYRYQLILQ
ncbi:MAG: GNAT family N-acetyltransferase [Bacteroidales bacterium]|nr:GNAT family N-acetyltransferase [Bacteroidales bacterium]